MRTRLGLGLVVLLIAGCASRPSAHREAVVPPIAVPTTGERAAALALGLVGTPYRYGGNGPDAFDCSGLVAHVYEDALGIRLPRTSRTG